MEYSAESKSKSFMCIIIKETQRSVSKLLSGPIDILPLPKLLSQPVPKFVMKRSSQPFLPCLPEVINTSSEMRTFGSHTATKWKNFCYSFHILSSSNKSLFCFPQIHGMRIHQSNFKICTNKQKC